MPDCPEGICRIPDASRPGLTTIRALAPNRGVAILTADQWPGNGSSGIRNAVAICGIKSDIGWPIDARFVFPQGV